MKKHIWAASLLPASLSAEPLNWWKPYSAVNSGDTAWVMTAAALVLLMTLPGLALFYGGMVRKKNLLSTMMHSFSIATLVGILWVAVGYSLAFTPGNAFIGGLGRVFLSGMQIDAAARMLTVSPNAPTVPEPVFMFFQMTFAIISTAIITGAFAERMKYSAMMLFSGIWFLLVYVPGAHWVWGGGFMSKGGVLDYAGGTVVHINAGIAGLVAALVLGRRIGYGREAMPPHNMAMTLIGAAMLWFGWFGFNAGSALAADAAAGMAMAVTQVSAVFGAAGWLACEKIAGHKPSALGLASGAVSGLVGITPAAACFVSVTVVKHKLRYDDSLDAFGIHGFGGLVGGILTGIFFDNRIFGGDAAVWQQLWIQVKDGFIMAAYSGLMSWAILKAVGKICGGLRVGKDVEREGLDLNIHGEHVE
ncbi:TPA: ammonium transporter [Neisseria gonorrhoeae]